jgi:hypothetical protein
MPQNSLHIQLKPISWNVLARKNHWIFTSTFDEWKQATFKAARAAKMLPAPGPCTVHVHAKWKWKKRHDIDALCTKPVFDQLVAMGIFPDDNLGFIKAVTFTGEIGADEDALILEYKI